MLEMRTFDLRGYYKSDQNCLPVLRMINEEYDANKRISILTIDIQHNEASRKFKPKPLNFFEQVEFNLNLTPNFVFIRIYTKGSPPKEDKAYFFD